ncbi:hypothetical protein E7T06_19030 [Deinococcus sp. Arct2-2]|uniref:hypothetical protein n=1 Tax=Deinococcus sp. Arct2-2 TaxID=2568653 RepID=UPI0010A54514|nr:hypothetical protein [Deinococcus sp. Arct2-2]THF67886.1 hypothetical protein E7T06_19030 [Deinococcus sp. Arct2-2]
MPRDKVLTQHTHPPELATIETLKLKGLQPGDDQAVAARFSLRTGDRDHLSSHHRGSRWPAEQLEGMTSLWKEPRDCPRRAGSPEPVS